MTVASPPLTDSMQALIDARLDTIDRMLLGRVHRQDRLAIVREVELQIHDLLGERDADDLDREGVLAVLARLDPPEAYLPDEAVDGPGTPRVAATTARPSPSRRPAGAGAGEGRITRVGGILGMIAFGLVLVAPMLWILVELTDSEVLAYLGFAVLIFLVSASGIAAVTLAIYARLRDSWAVVGLLLGVISTGIAVVGGVLLFMIL